MKSIIFKIICLIVCATTIFLSISTHTGAEEFCHWYIKKHKGKAPSFPKAAEHLKEYDVYYIDEDSSDKIIYLTFDAGYENGNVEKILDVLKAENVPAAFFLLDNIILKNTDLVSRMFDEGHTVCNHTKNHKNLSNASYDEISRNLSALEKLCEEKTGYQMAKYFRFPEGSYSISALKSIKSLGYKTIFWSFAYDDWDNDRQMDSKKAFNKIIENTHNGAVVLLHPTSETNAEIMQDLILKWKEMGYRFGTLDELTSK